MKKSNAAVAQPLPAQVLPQEQVSYKKNSSSQPKTSSGKTASGKGTPVSSFNQHIHASNCGHKSFMHGNHVDYLHEGRYEYMVDGKPYPCTGPGTPISSHTGSSKKSHSSGSQGAVVLPFPSKGKKK